jgi:hypothetical protein
VLPVVDGIRKTFLADLRPVEDLAKNFGILLHVLASLWWIIRSGTLFPFAEHGVDLLLLLDSIVLGRVPWKRRLTSYWKMGLVGNLMIGYAFMTTSTSFPDLFKGWRGGKVNFGI